MKRTVALITAVILVFCLSACNGGNSIGTPAVSVPEPAANGIFARIDPIIDEAVLIMDTVRQDDLSPVTFNFEKRLEYDTLNEEEKALYDEMILKVRAFEPFSYSADEYGYDVLDRVLIVFGAIITDWPELENYFIINDVLEGNMTAALESRYFMPWDAMQEPASIDALREETALFDAVCRRIVERMPEGLSAYDQYRYLAAVISLATDYDYAFADGWQNRTAYGSIVSGYSICQGYSIGFMTLCRKAGLWCVTVSGMAGENEGHMWNMVKLDTGDYHVDITWSDGRGMPDSAEWLSCFMLTEDEILVDHMIDDMGENEP